MYRTSLETWRPENSNDVWYEQCRRKFEVGSFQEYRYSIFNPTWCLPHSTFAAAPPRALSVIVVVLAELLLQHYTAHAFNELVLVLELVVRFRLRFARDAPLHPCTRPAPNPPNRHFVRFG